MLVGRSVVHTYIHTYVHTWIHTYIHTCIHTYIHRGLGMLSYDTVMLIPKWRNYGDYNDNDDGDNHDDVELGLGTLSCGMPTGVGQR